MVRSQRGIDDIDEFALLMDDYLDWPEKTGEQALKRARLLQSWIQGKGVDLRNAPLLSKYSADVPSLFKMFHEASEATEGQMQDTRDSYEAWARQPGGDFWLHQVGSNLLIAVKFDDGDSIHLWFSSQAHSAEVLAVEPT